MKWLYLLLLSSSFALPPVEELPRLQAIQTIYDWNHKGNEFGVQWVNFTGSMRPYLRGGETVLIIRYTGQPIHRHDLIAYELGDNRPLVLHEVIDVGWGMFKTKGLNCDKPDGWFPSWRAKWIVKRVVRIKLT